MSKELEELDLLNIPDATEESDDPYETIKIPVIAEEPPESDQTEDNGSEQELSGDVLELQAKEQSDQSSSSLASNEVTTSEQVSDYNLTESDTTSRYSKDYQILMDKIEAIRGALKTTVVDATATGITQGRWDNSYPHLKKACFFLCLLQDLFYI